MTFKLFASVYKDMDTVQKNRIKDHALELHTCSALFTVDADSFEEAQELFLKSDVCESFCDEHPNRSIYIIKL